MDIVGGATSSLVEACQAVVRHDAQATWVNLLFDHEDDAVRVRSPYTHGRLPLRIEVKRPARVFVRMPSWVDATGGPGSAGGPAGGTGFQPVGPGGHRVETRATGPYLELGLLHAGQAVEVDLGSPLPRRRIVLHHRTHDIRVDLRGDEPVAMDNFGADLTFFDPLE